MHASTGVRRLAALCAVAALGGCGGQRPAAPREHWVAGWIASPSNAAGVTLHDQTLRMVVSPRLGGSVLRVRLTNRFGGRPVTLGPVAIGVQSRGAALVPGTVRRVPFDGRATVTIAPGGDAVSDPVALAVRPFTRLAVSLAVPGTVPSPTEHLITRETSYATPAGSGDHALDPGSRAFTISTTGVSSAGWYLLDGLDVGERGCAAAVVAFGDSITDGYQGRAVPNAEDLRSVGREERYPDFLSRRVLARGEAVSVVNAGLSSNRILTGAPGALGGPSALARFRADALDEPGVTTVLILEGINDIDTMQASAPAIEGGLTELVGEAHRAGVRAVLGTLTPARGAGPREQATREAVNAWIRTQRVADGVADFDAAVRDPSDPRRLAPRYDGGDHLHLSPAGYRAMADVVRLTDLPSGRCPAARAG